MISAEGDELRPVEVVGPRGSGAPLPFTTPAPPPPGPVRRWPRVLLVGVVGAALAAAFYLTAGTGGRAGGSPVARSGGPAAVGSPVPSEAPRKAMVQLVNQELAAQSRALLTGDLAGYLAPVDAALRDDFTQRFGSLRALGVAAWNAYVASVPSGGDEGRWTMTVGVGFCFGTADCTPMRLVMPSTWSFRDGRAVITGVQRTALPWDMTALRAVAGRRVVVAAPVGAAVPLERILSAADKAADVVDRFARWEAPPQRYVVYVAGPEQWHTWWNGTPDDYAGYAAGPYGIVVKDSLDAEHGLVNVLTHEFTHVVSLGNEYPAGQYWWLSEGLAEYAADGDGAWTRDRLPYVRRFVKGGRWDGTMTLGAMPKDASEEVIFARYGVALLAVTCLAKRFGEERMLAFFGAVVRDRSNPEVASPTVFGLDWASVAAGCTAEIRTRSK